MNTKAPLPARTPSYEVIEGVDCALVPLGREGKQGTAVCEKADWDRYLFRGYSPNIRLNSSGNVVTGHRQSSQGRSKDVTVASVILGSKKGHRIRYADGNRCNLRSSNLSYRKGKGRPEAYRPNMPDPRKGSKKVHAECIVDDFEAAQRREQMTQEPMQHWELSLETDFDGMTLEEILALDEFKDFDLS